ncbi:MAG: beta-glucosidase [Bacteroidales bacterium]|nr:beta-glucosidase [Bacteroidales bacterium]
MQITVVFSSPVNLDRLDRGKLYLSGYNGALSIVAGPTETAVTVCPESALEPFRRYSLVVEKGENLGLSLIDEYRLNIITAYDTSDKFPRIGDEELLTLVQRQTFRYFWDYAHPVCGLARERLGSDGTVTTGGSGFGIMTLPVAVERGFVTREEAAERLRTIVGFLAGKADRFHGAFPHWLNGSTGATIPFSANDDGGDLVETSFLMEGLLAAAMYFDRPEEADIRNAIDAIWRGVEWDWYTRGGQDVLYWHWSPDKDWAMNMKISGWNEGLMSYLLAAASPTHPIPASAYHKGWARDGAIKNGRRFYDITLPLGSDLGGPMFFAHYSFLGLDPRGLKDDYADYWEQNVAHARINHAYCAANPRKHAGYSADCWGLTASDISGGYTASSPSNDRGTIAPTAALASMPYTPEESLAAMRTFYYVYGDRLWGEYGFRDAFSLDSAWFASSCIAIDQGPIVVMIENYRTGLLWECFMKHPDVCSGLKKLGFRR